MQPKQIRNDGGVHKQREHRRLVREPVKLEHQSRFFNLFQQHVNFAAVAIPPPHL